MLFPVRHARSIPPTVRRHSIHSVLKRPSSPAQEPTNGHGGPLPVLHLLPPQCQRGKYLQFEPFDEAYLDRLRMGDLRAQEHFSAYFAGLIQIKLRSRLKSPEAIEDVRQETFARFFLALREDRILQPQRLGSFVNSICNNVLKEKYRSDARDTSLDDDEQKDIPAQGVGILDALAMSETEETVRQILQELPERDRRLLKEVFLEERDKDEVCRELGVSREYLRVLLHRAKQAFKALYLNNMGEPPEFAEARGF